MLCCLLPWELHFQGLKRQTFFFPLGWKGIFSPSLVRSPSHPPRATNFIGGSWLAGSSPWKPPPPLPIPNSCAGSVNWSWALRFGKEGSFLGCSEPLWRERLAVSPSCQRQCQRPWGSLVWSCSGCWRPRLQGVSKAAATLFLPGWNGGSPDALGTVFL